MSDTNTRVDLDRMKKACDATRANTQRTPEVPIEDDLSATLKVARMFGLAEAGKTNSKGMPNPLQVSVTALQYEPEFRLATPPWVFQEVVLTGLAVVARRFGYRP